MSITMKMAQAIAKDIANGADSSTMKESVRELAVFFELCVQTWESWSDAGNEYDKALGVISRHVDTLKGETNAKLEDAVSMIVRWRRPAPRFSEDVAHCYPSGGPVCVFCGHDPDKDVRTPCLTSNERGDMVQALRQKKSEPAPVQSDADRGDWILRSDGGLLLCLGGGLFIAWDKDGVIQSSGPTHINGVVFKDDARFKTASFFTAILKMLAKNMEIEG